ncbi:hypothetical protein CHU_3288 [Cytophaga hutchinsonii ATCC 33406]|uniref:Uncharacterized protein n=1 Tax=Cytophaga hutchinsonii (strain ATCC 33406 / DSM 1761 / CIP 103989 / NBRC 15051 / NCIMB 9469 / D465) TaxID=269798 RepID=A0A6N4SVQ3_CYTH3|nr:hypothetical protein CHU_3288 [Cytophaga hutchinsonii ATCC 33406]
MPFSEITKKVTQKNILYDPILFFIFSRENVPEKKFYFFRKNFLQFYIDLIF